LVERLDSEPHRELAENYVVSTTPALPKRTQRPVLRPPYVTKQTYQSRCPENDQLEPLLKLTILHNEYYDIVDDVFDGDVADGYEPTVFLLNESLIPLLTSLVHQLGPEAVSIVSIDPASASPVSARW
jgi:hypothetical protein